MSEYGFKNGNCYADKMVANTMEVGGVPFTGKGLANRITVGVNGDFTTVKAAVDWFNASATADMEIIIDCGHFPFADTVTVNNGSYTLMIRGAGSGQVYFEAATGLTGKPMFEIKSDCDMSRFTGDGSTLASYGTLAGENFITYSTTGGIYSEITDFVLDTFTIGISDTIGMDNFVFNFIISNCGTGIVRNHASATVTSIDAEVGHFDTCGVGVDLIATGVGKEDFSLLNLFCLNNGANIGIRYDGANYLPNNVANIFSCTWDGLGTYMTGFDFTRADGRDANIEIRNNIGEENKTPHTKINVVDNAATTTITTSGTYYKLNGIKSVTRIVFDAAATAGTWTITVDDQTTAAIQWNASAANIKTAVEGLSNVTTVTVTQIIASKEWTIQFDTAGEGWVNQSADVSGLTTTTSADVQKSFYTCRMTLNQNRMTYQSTHVTDGVIWLSGNVQVDNPGRNVTIGMLKNATGKILGPMTVRCATASQPYPFSTIIYLDDMASTNYFEMWATSSTSGDIVTLQDLTWWFDTR